MAQRNRTVPDSDKDVVRWVYNVGNTIAAEPEIYGFTPDDADLLVNLSAELISKYITARRPTTRTKPAIRAKNDSRKKALGTFRSYIRQVNANPDVTVELKVGLGIVIPQRRSSPLPAPMHQPALWLRQAGPGVHTLGYWNVDAMTRRRKPRGVTHLVLLCAVSDRPVSDPAAARYVGCFTRRPIRVTHVPQDAGKYATYFGAWVTGSGKQSAWSPGVSLMIAFGGPGAAPADKG